MIFVILPLLSKQIISAGADFSLSVQLSARFPDRGGLAPDMGNASKKNPLQSVFLFPIPFPSCPAFPPEEKGKRRWIAARPPPFFYHVLP